MTARRTAAPLPSTRHLPGVPGADSRPAPDPSSAPAGEEAFAYACDLFDERYFWEAHEAWESEWRALPRRSVEADLLQGLICAAAFLVKREQSLTAPLLADAAARIRSRAEASLGRVIAARGPVGRGIRLDRLLAALAAFDAGGPHPTLEAG